MEGQQQYCHVKNTTLDIYLQFKMKVNIFASQYTSYFPKIKPKKNLPEPAVSIDAPLIY